MNICSEGRVAGDTSKLAVFISPTVKEEEMIRYFLVGYNRSLILFCYFDPHNSSFLNVLVLGVFCREEGAENC